MSSQSPSASETGDEPSEQVELEPPTDDAKGERQASEILIETRPTVQPTLILMGVTVLLGLGLTGYVASNPETFGGPETARILLQVISAVALLVLVRLIITVFVLTRTTYRITTSRITREYTLLLRTWEREVPVGMIRSSELQQSRVQKLLGYGTVRVNRGLGAIRLENVREPDEIRDALTKVIDRESRAGV